MKISAPFRSLPGSPTSSLVGAFVCWSLAGAGCAGNALDGRDLGNTTTPVTPTPVISKDGVDPFVVGHWLGHAEDLFAATGPDGIRPVYSFPSGSTDITLDLNLSDGTIVFGAGDVPEPLPGVAYPPGFDAYASFSVARSRIEQLPPLEGFAYFLTQTVDAPSAAAATGALEPTGIAAGALELGYVPNAAYGDWCDVQTPRPTPSGRFDCSTPKASTNAQDCSIYHAFDCNLGALCQPDTICHCFSDRCYLESDTYNQVWLVRDGDDLLGTFVGAVFDYGDAGRFLPLGTVRFQHESH